MKLYADLPVRRTLQVLADAGFLLWVLLWILVSQKVHDAVLELAGPGRRIDASATDLAGRLREAGDRVGDVPLVGEQAKRPFDGAGGAAEGLAGAGRAQVEAVQGLAFWLTLAVGVIPIALLLLVWLPVRLRFVRRATAGQRYLDSTADLDLFALRAIANQPLHVLARVHDDPAGAWRRAEPAIIGRLAALELRSVGLRARPPAPAADRLGR